MQSAHYTFHDTVHRLVELAADHTSIQTLKYVFGTESTLRCHHREQLTIHSTVTRYILRSFIKQLIRIEQYLCQCRVSSHRLSTKQQLTNVVNKLVYCISNTTTKRKLAQDFLLESRIADTPRHKLINAGQSVRVYVHAFGVGFLGHALHQLGKTVNSFTLYSVDRLGNDVPQHCMGQLMDYQLSGQTRVLKTRIQQVDAAVGIRPTTGIRSELLWRKCLGITN